MKKDKEINEKIDEEHKDDKGNEDVDTTTNGELEIDETFAVRGVGIVVSGTVTGGKIISNQKLYLGPFSDGNFKEIITRSVHIKRCNVKYAQEGESCSISFRFLKRKEIVDRSLIRKGMVLVSHINKDKLSSNISGNYLGSVWAFTANILVLHHPTTINPGYQPVVHCGNIRQTATIMKMNKERLRSGDHALVDLKFLCHPEFMHLNRALIIREGNTKCIGKVVLLHPIYNINNNGEHFQLIEQQLKKEAKLKEIYQQKLLEKEKEIENLMQHKEKDHKEKSKEHKKNQGN